MSGRKWITPSTLIIASLIIAACCATVTAYWYEPVSTAVAQEAMSADAYLSEDIQFMAADSDDSVRPTRVPSAWTAYRYSDYSFGSISMTDHNHLWGIGSRKLPDGTAEDVIFHFDGSSFQPELITSEFDLWFLDVLPDGAGYAVGERRNNSETIVLKRVGNQWVLVYAEPEQPDNGINSLHVRSVDDVWIGRGPRRYEKFMHFDGITWSAISSTASGTSSVYGIDTISQDLGWAVGGYMGIFLFSNGQWERKWDLRSNLGNHDSLYAVDALTSTDIWVAGKGIYRYVNGEWRKEQSSPSRCDTYHCFYYVFWDIAMISPVEGYSNNWYYIWKYDGGKWTQMEDSHHWQRYIDIEAMEGSDGKTHVYVTTASNLRHYSTEPLPVPPATATPPPTSTPTVTPTPTNTATPTMTPTNTPTPTPKPYSENITTGGGKVVSNDRYASTTIDIPPDAVSEEIIFTYEHRGPGVPVYRSGATGGVEASADSTAADVRMLEGVRHFFVLKASTLDGDRIFILDKPISISVRYRADERGPVIDGTLEMYRHDGESYVQDNITQISNDGGVVVAETSHLGMFGVLGETERTYLPLVDR